jgi:hypothetical protein
LTPSLPPSLPPPSQQSNPNSIELSYCRDNNGKKNKRHVIDLASIIGIRPTPKIGSADNIFAIETKERKYVLKAADVHIKNIWLAKLCEYCGQGKQGGCCGQGGILQAG